MSIEHKVLPLEQAAITDAGSASGYGAVFGNLDDGGDIIEPGFFSDTIDEFLLDGFIGWSHEWWTPVAFPTSAKEDAHGLHLGWQYHSTQKAQDVRAITSERLAAGKRMGLSIGYELGEQQTKPDGRHLLKASRLFEVSLVMVPMNREAGVLEAKGLRMKAALAPHESGTSTDAWDAAEAEAALGDAEAGTLRQAYAWQDPDGDPDTKAAYKFAHHFISADGSVGAASTVACSAGIAVLNGGRGGADIPDSDRAGVHRHLAAHLRDAELEAPPLKGLPAGLTYGAQAEDVLSGLREWRDRTVDLLSKEGRAISEARRSRLGGHVEALEAVLADLRGLLDETAPPEKAAAWLARARVRMALAEAEHGISI